jgi:hypothetical protein
MINDALLRMGAPTTSPAISVRWYAPVPVRQRQSALLR